MAIRVDFSDNLFYIYNIFISWVPIRLLMGYEYSIVVELPITTMHKIQFINF